MKQILLIMVVAVACGAAGYELGRRSTADAWQKERISLYKQRSELANKIRQYRDHAQQGKRPSPKSARKAPPPKPTAAKGRSPATRPTTQKR